MAAIQSASSAQLNQIRANSKAIAEKLCRLARPRPVNPSVPGDQERFACEMFKFKVTESALLALKQTEDNLAEAIELATNPRKKKQINLAFQKLPQNAEKLAALQKLLESPRS